MKNNYLLYLHILILCVFATTIESIFAESIKTTTTFNLSDLNIAIDTINGTRYTQLTLPNTNRTVETGKPRLPIKYINFSVPYNATDFEVSAIVKASTNITIPAIVYPVQPPVKTSENYNNSEFTMPELSTYNSVYPSNIAIIKNEGFLDGDNHIITIGVCPISYNGSSSQATFNTTLEVILEYSTATSRSNTTTNSLAPIKHQLASQETVDRNIVKQFVVNPEQVDNFASSSIVIPNYRVPIDYVVITNKALAPAFNRLISWKCQKGYKAKVICIEDILSDPSVQNGDEISNINDNAGKLRQYLRNLYYNNKLKFALFGGDNTILPIRYSGISINSGTPTDMYFSDFNGSWGISGKMDYMPEIYVGRILCKTTEGINNYTEKLLRYELNPGNGDYSYLRKAFYTQADDMLRDHEANAVADDFATVFTNQTIFSETPSYDDPNPTFPTGQQVVNEMNNRYGFFSWHGHGSPEGVTVKANGVKGNNYGISSLEGQQKYLQIETGNGLDNLTNQNYPAISYSIGCDLCPFDIYENYNFKYNFGASFTVGGLYGGPAFLGNARYGYCYYSSLLEREFVKCINSGIYNLGIAEAMSKVNYNEDSWLKLTHCLIGDPDLEMWTSIPSKYEDVVITRTNSNIRIQCYSMYGSKVVTLDKSGDLVTYIGSSQYINLGSNVSPNSPIMIFSHNKIPYIAPLYLQNETTNKSQYLQTNNVYIGNNVDSNRSAGDYVISSGGNLVLEAAGDIEIKPGFVVESGGNVTLKCKGSVKISGGCVKGGGKLSIYSENIYLSDSFTAEKGAELLLTK